MKKIISIVLMTAMVFTIVAVFTGCGNGQNEDKPLTIVGKWQYEGTTFIYTFKEDGTGDYSGMAFTYTTDGNKLSILYDGYTVPFETEYEITGNKLNVKDSNGSDTFYTRVD